MPPFLMLLGVAFVVLMVMFGNNPVEKWKAEQQKYGKDPLAREINKMNDEKNKKGKIEKYRPPPGATTYRLPPNQAQLMPSNPFTMPGEDELVHPAPDVPMSEWDSPYPSHMLSPNSNSNYNINPNIEGSTPVLPNKNRGTSLLPGGE